MIIYILLQSAFSCKPSSGWNWFTWSSRSKFWSIHSRVFLCSARMCSKLIWLFSPAVLFHGLFSTWCRRSSERVLPLGSAVCEGVSLNRWRWFLIMDTASTGNISTGWLDIHLSSWRLSFQAAIVQRAGNGKYFETKNYFYSFPTLALVFSTVPVMSVCPACFLIAAFLGFLHGLCSHWK